jgi:metal-responsive CopG/Arc/MetJ family transcriptional regulator
MTHAGMKKVTFSLEEEQLEAVDEFQEEHDISSRSEAVRRLIGEYEELQRQYEELHTEYEQLETELEHERDRNRMILEQREEHDELVRYVEEERSAEQRWREAGIGQRIKWRLFGMDSEEE